MKMIWSCLLSLSILLLSVTAQATGTLSVTYYHNDATGSPVAATNQQGQVVWRKVYTPYGEASGRDRDNRIGYTGHVEDANGLIFAGARYYDPMLGRFLSTDSVGFTEKNLMSFNRYAYANDNPFRFVDPDGRTPHDIEVARKIAVETQRDLKFPETYGQADLGYPAITIVGDGHEAPLGTILDSHYYGELKDSEAADLLDTIIHEAVHFSFPASSKANTDENDKAGTGTAYDEAKKRTTRGLINRFNKERKEGIQKKSENVK